LLTNIGHVVDNIDENADKTVNRLDLIYADMVGEITFTAAIAELNAAIAALGVDIDASIGVATTAIVGGVDSAIAAQTIALGGDITTAQTAIIQAINSTSASTVDALSTVVSDNITRLIAAEAVNTQAIVDAVAASAVSINSNINSSLAYTLQNMYVLQSDQFQVLQLFYDKFGRTCRVLAPGTEIVVGVKAYP